MSYTPEKRKANREKWCQALESGKYKQGKAYLFRDGNYCCLGVLCEVAIKEGVAIKRNTEDDCLYDDCVGDAPTAAMEFVGLTDSNGNFLGDSLVNLNDIKGKDFFEIAQIIRSEPEGLFLEEGS